MASSPSSTPVFSHREVILRVAIQAPSSLDPVSLGDPASELVARQLYQGLVDWDEAKSEVVPAVAKRWSSSDHERTWTFELRSTRFTDGNPVTANDFVFAFDRIAQKKTGSDLAFLLDEVKGFARVNAGHASHLRGVAAVDDHTLRIELSRPDANFDTVLTHPALVPLEPSAVSNLGSFLRRPVSNGPFKMAVKWSPGAPVILTANRDYRSPPAVDGIRFDVYDNPTAAYKDLVAGRIDVSEVPPLAIDDAVTRFGTRGFKPFLSASYYAFNFDKKQFRNRRLRVAVSHAIDRERIARRIYQGTLSLPRGVVPSGIPGFSSDVCGKACDYRPVSARRVVRTLPAKDRSIVVQTNGGDPYESVNKAISKDLRKAGFHVRARSYPFARYLRLMASGKQDLYRLSWLAEYPDPDVFLHDLFSTKGSGNQSGFSNNRVDALVSEAMRTQRTKKRLRLYRRAERTIVHTLPVVPIGTYETHWAARRSVHGIVFDDTGGFDVSGATIANR